MKILVTGGLGYIGGRLISYFKEKCPDIDIVIADRIPSVIPSWAQDIKYFPLELLSEENVKECIANIKPECIIHLAALNEIDCSKDPELADKVNCRGTKFLVENALKYKVEHFIYFSTFHVYGKSATGVITEDTNPIPLNSYASTHLDAERVVSLSRSSGMKILLFRLSNSYGYPMDKNIKRWTLLVNDLCRQAVVTGKMVLMSSGKQKRDFISLGDVTEAVRYFLFEIYDKWKDGLYNLGSGKTISIIDMARNIKDFYFKKYGKRIELILRDNSGKKDDDVIDFEYSVDKLKRTGFILQNNMEDEVYKTMDVCEELK
jgi:UDP-glucose 4-epimerase